MTSNIASAQDANVRLRGPQVRGSRKSAQQSWPANRGRNAILLAIVLAAAARLPRDRPSQQHAIMAAIVLAAAAGLAWDSQTRSRARLAAWDRRRYARYQRTATPGP